MDVRSQISGAFSDPTVAYLLLLGGGILIILECLRPRHGFAGVPGAVLVTLALHSLAHLSFNTYGTILLILSIVIVLTSLRRTSYLGLFSSGLTFAAGSAFLVSGDERIDPAAALAGGVFMSVCHALLRIGCLARALKRY